MSRPSNERALRSWLAGKLHRRIADPLWEYLVDERLVAMALDPEEDEGLEDLLDHTSRLIEVAGEAPVKRERPPAKSARLEALPPSREMRRARTFCTYIGRRATQHPAVRHFRSKVLGKPKLSHKQAEALLQSEAPQHFGLGFFRSRGIPLIGHKCHALHYGPNGPEQSYDFSDNTKFRIEWDGGVIEEPYTTELWLEKSNPEIYQPLEILEYRGKVRWRSVFGELRTASIRLTESYGWSESESSWFILTGDIPYKPPIQVLPKGMLAQDHTRVEFTILIQPWVSPATVLRVYKHAQRLALGRRSRPLGERSLALFDLVSERYLTGRKRPPWRAMMETWNRKHPDWNYDHPLQFWRDYRRTARALVFPDYIWPFHRPAEREKSER